MLLLRALTRRTSDGVVIGPVDLDVPAGGTVALMGASGSGKSLLLRAIADLDPAEGHVILDGVERSKMPAPEWRRRVVYVAAESGWWDDTVAAHFADTTAAAALLPRLGLPAKALGWSVSRLSSGERQRLALARALTLPRQPGTARAYLLDEPTASLDAESTARLEEVIASLPDERTALLLVTHDAGQAQRLAGQAVLHLRDGSLTAEAAQ